MGVDTTGELVNIGHLAKATGVSSRTIRYYEELGIIPEPPRSPGGTRRYPRGYSRYIEGALALKELGFSLEEIRLLGRLAPGSGAIDTERDRAIAVVDEQARMLQLKVEALQRLRQVVAQAGEALSEIVDIFPPPHVAE